VSVAVRSSRPSCSKAKKREYSWQIGSHPGNPGFNRPDSGRGAGLARCALHRPDPRAAESSRHRMAAIAIAYALLTVIELWRWRGDGTRRWPIMLLLLGLQRSAEADCRG
jgi:hypothetical protein